MSEHKKEQELQAREQDLDRRERELAQREAELGVSRDPFSQAVHEKKIHLYDKVPLKERHLTWIIRTVYVLLAVTVVLIILEAAGVYSIWGK